VRRRKKKKKAGTKMKKSLGVERMYKEILKEESRQAYICPWKEKNSRKTKSLE